MKCPTDGATLQMTDRQGVEIDYCPQCRGVWLDRGELDKIIERSETSAPKAREEQPRYQEERSSHHDDRDRDHGYHKKHKKEGFLGDLFDF
jgi:hypothetical protein